MKEQKTQTEGFCFGSRRHETQVASVKMKPLCEKAFYSKVEDWTYKYTLNTTAWD